MVNATLSIEPKAKIPRAPHGPPFFSMWVAVRMMAHRQLPIPKNSNPTEVGDKWKEKNSYLMVYRRNTCE